MREEKVGGPALLSVSWSLCVLIAALLLWGGITMGALRGVLLALAAAAMPLRRLASRLAAMAPMDGLSAAPLPGGVRRWGELAQICTIALAAGFCTFGSGSLIGPVLGLICAVLALARGWAGRTVRGPFDAAPTEAILAISIACGVSVIEPLWGWRGQSLVIGLFAIDAMLALRVLVAWPRRARRRP